MKTAIIDYTPVVLIILTVVVNDKYFSKADHPRVRKGAAVLRQEYIIVLTFLAKLTKGKEAGAKHINCQ